MTYSRLRFCAELIDIINKSADDDVISHWACDTLRDIRESSDRELYCIIDDLRYICEPGFEISRKEMLKICSKLLNEYIDSIDG